MGHFVVVSGLSKQALGTGDKMKGHLNELYTKAMASKAVQDISNKAKNFQQKAKTAQEKVLKKIKKDIDWSRSSLEDWRDSVLFMGLDPAVAGESDFHVRNIRQVLALPLHVEDAIGSSLALSSVRAKENIRDELGNQTETFGNETLVKAAILGEDKGDEMILLREIARAQAFVEEKVWPKVQEHIVHNVQEQFQQHIVHNVREHILPKEYRQTGTVEGRPEEFYFLPEPDFQVANLQSLLAMPFNVLDSAGSTLAMNSVLQRSPVWEEDITTKGDIWNATFSNKTITQASQDSQVQPSSSKLPRKQVADPYLFLHCAERTSGVLLLLLLAHVAYLLYKVPKYRQRFFHELEQQQPALITLNGDHPSSPMSATNSTSPAAKQRYINGNDNGNNEALQELLRQKHEECRLLTLKLHEATEELMRQPMGRDETESHMAKVQQLNSDLQELIEGKDLQLLNFSTQVQQLSKELTAREAQLANVLSLYSKQKEELETAEEKAKQEQEKVVVENTKRLQELEGSLRESKEICECLSKRLAEVSGELARYKREGYNNNNERLTEQLDFQTNKSEELQNELAHREEERQKIQEELDTQVSKSSDLMVKLQKQLLSNDQLKEQLDDQIVRALELEDKTRQRALGQNRLQPQLKDQNASITLLEQELQQQREEQARLQKKFDLRVKECKDLTEKLQKMEGAHYVIEQQLMQKSTMLQQKLDSQAESFKKQEDEWQRKEKLRTKDLEEQLQKQGQDLKSLSQKLAKKIESAKAMEEQFQKQADEHKQEQTKISFQVDSTRIQCKSIEKQLQKEQAKCKELKEAHEHELEKGKQKQQSLQKALGDQTRECRMAQQRVKQQAKQLHKAQARCKELEGEQLELLQEEKQRQDKLQTSLDALIKDHELAQKRLTLQGEQLQQENEKCKKLEQQQQQEMHAKGNHNKELQKLIDTQKEECRIAQEQVVQYEQELQKLQGHCQQLEEEKRQLAEEAKQQQARLQEELNTQAKMYEDTQAKLGQQEDQLKKEQARHKHLEKEQLRMQEEAQQQQDRLQALLDERTEQCEIVQKSLAQQESAQKDLQEQLDIQIRRCHEVDKQYRRQEVARSELQGQLDSQIERVRHQEEAHSELQNELATQCKELEARLEQSLSHSNLNELGEEVQVSEEGEATATISGNQVLGHSSSSLQANLQDQIEQVNLLQKQVEHQKSLHAKQQERNQILLETNQTLSEMVEERQKRCVELEQTTATLSQQLEKYQRQGEVANKLRIEELRALRQEKLSKARELMSSQTIQAHEEQESLSSMKKELQEQQDVVLRLRAEIDRVKRECNEQISEMRSQQQGLQPRKEMTRDAVAKKEDESSPMPSVGEDTGVQEKGKEVDVDPANGPGLNDVLSSEVSCLFGL